MVIRTTPFRVPFPRRLLIRIHQDLFRIEKCARAYVQWPFELSNVEMMVLISEDRRFFRHNGIDYLSWAREIFKALTFRRFGGASTIDMQFVRAATGYYDRSIRRKIYEMLLAWLIQHKYSKIEILRYYLRIAFFGSHLYGVERTSQRVFSKWQLDLTLEEAADIASMLVYPRPREPTERWAEKIRRRSKYILSVYPGLKQRFEQLPSWEAV
jgi:membrane peptidoglycan carboxypeptidase